MKRQLNILIETDWLSVVFYLILIAFGWVNIFAVNYAPGGDPFFSLSHRYTMQLAWIFVSMLAIMTIFIIDSRFFSFVAYPAYGLALLLLLAVLVVGTTINDSKSWIVMGPISIQPSEFAKTATILALARFLSGYNVKITRMRDILITAGIIFLPPLFIMLQPDFGSTLVYGIILLVLYREGLPGWILVVVVSLATLFLFTLLFQQFTILIILLSVAFVIFFAINRRKTYLAIGLFALGASLTLFILLNYLNIFKISKYHILLLSTLLFTLVSAGLGFKRGIKGLLVVLLGLYITLGFTYSVDFVFHNIMKEHQQNRVNVMLGLESDPYGYEYNVRQSKIAIGSGGFAGKGFMQGTQTKFKFVPEQSTDFIFCTVGEEWGFLGSFGMLLVYMGLLIRLIYLAERQRSKFSRIYGYGVMAILFFHFAVNLGMTIGLFPVIGIPLPFISYGGSSLLAFSILLFIFLRLDASRKTYLV